jgi:kelch-like protein 10
LLYIHVLVYSCYVSVATVDEYIYAMGGFDGHIRQNTAERYLPSKNQWSMIPSMNHQRSDARATSLHGKLPLFNYYHRYYQLT